MICFAHGRSAALSFQVDARSAAAASKLDAIGMLLASTGDAIAAAGRDASARFTDAVSRLKSSESVGVAQPLASALNISLGDAIELLQAVHAPSRGGTLALGFASEEWSALTRALRSALSSGNFEAISSTLHQLVQLLHQVACAACVLVEPVRDTKSLLRQSVGLGPVDPPAESTIRGSDQAWSSVEDTLSSVLSMDSLTEKQFLFGGRQPPA